ncbi:hypothetical protein [Rhodanobacter lindaniclasticus]
MKIGTTIHPKRGAHAHKGERHVAVADTTYVFRATTDKHGATHYVADVSNPDHAATLLKIDAYYAFDPSMQPKSVLVREDTTTPPPPPIPIESPHKAAAVKLLADSATVIGQEIGKLDTEQAFAIVQAAVALEEGTEKPRRNVLTLLQATLEGLTASGNGS